MDAHRFKLYTMVESQLSLSNSQLESAWGCRSSPAYGAIDLDLFQ